MLKKQVKKLLWCYYHGANARFAIYRIKSIKKAHEKEIEEHKTQISVLMNRIKNKKYIIQKYDETLVTLRKELEKK